MKFTRSPKKTPASPRETPEPDTGDVSPELVPIITLLSSQAHRRYHEGIFMLYYDLNGDGKPADRQWKEVYGILTGNQLAYWDAATLARFTHQPEQMAESSSKPNYLNFTDAAFNALTVLPAAKQQLENVIIVLTTLKNRYIIQFRTYAMLTDWYAALRLALFEYKALQEAYTGALLSARGLRLSDIHTVLAEKRFNHHDWVKIRYGLGMAWRRCYAVIEPSSLKRKAFAPGRVLLYDSDTMKKKNLVGVIASATLVTAVYPQLPFFIDQSTIMKLEGTINFSPHRRRAASGDHESALFIMPEHHSAVPGFDTLIRFLVPLFDAFGLYGRPAKLKADRIDPDSLLFGLPTLPHVHYLQLADVAPLTASPLFLEWDLLLWERHLKHLLALKLAQGYDGCGSTRGFLGAISSLNSPRGSPMMAPAKFARLASGPVSPNERLAPAMRAVTDHRPYTPDQPVLRPDRSALPPDAPASPEKFPSAVLGPRSSDLPEPELAAAPGPSGSRNVHNLALDEPNRKSLQLADIYHKYFKIQTPSDQFNNRNEILNGSAEELDEEALPSLIRKKSLMHGPYPTTDRHLLNSDSDSDSVLSDSDSLVQQETPLLVPKARAAHSPEPTASAHSPYHDFTAQLSQSMDRLSVHSDSPPSPPRHHAADALNYPYEAQQLPQIQQLQLWRAPKTLSSPLHSPSSAQTSFAGQPLGPPLSSSVPKSAAATNLRSVVEDADRNKPRYIMSPNSSQNQVHKFEQVQSSREPPRPQMPGEDSVHHHAQKAPLQAPRIPSKQALIPQFAPQNLQHPQLTAQQVQLPLQLPQLVQHPQRSPQQLQLPQLSPQPAQQNSPKQLQLPQLPPLQHRAPVSPNSPHYRTHGPPNQSSPGLQPQRLGQHQSHGQQQGHGQQQQGHGQVQRVGPQGLAQGQRPGQTLRSGQQGPAQPQGPTQAGPGPLHKPGQPQGGYPQGSQSQGGYPQGGYPQGGYPQGNQPQGGHSHGGYSQGGYSQGGYPQGGYHQGNQPLGGYPQGNHPQRKQPPSPAYGQSSDQHGQPLRSPNQYSLSPRQGSSFPRQYDPQPHGPSGSQSGPRNQYQRPGPQLHPGANQSAQSIRSYGEGNPYQYQVQQNPHSNVRSHIPPAGLQQRTNGLGQSDQRNNPGDDSRYNTGYRQY